MIVAKLCIIVSLNLKLIRKSWWPSPISILSRIARSLSYILSRYLKKTYLFQRSCQSSFKAGTYWLLLQALSTELLKQHFDSLIVLNFNLSKHILHRKYFCFGERIFDFKCNKWSVEMVYATVNLFSETNSDVFSDHRCIRCFPANPYY